ncbi:TniQ family protein [Limnoraphis robusta Tam1]|uniref:TniQ family protein n=1 Tax=Limnoraphis robusta TaxID=1118279 RepID=UPI002B202D21|nr:TniQ family protein [Limnoraphis robusta]MEA5499175.1 TniQ family protein [Limnoraphis robusta BA-68 BA1]MEA5540704.1 TniQ family protein [Limnoraphis robusta Tam1]
MTNRKPQLFTVEPLKGESLSHFLGRFQRENYLKPAQLGKLTGLGATISRWEKLYLNPFPQPQELEALAAIVQVEVDRLMLMLPHRGMTLQPRPILLCGACYQENPCHQIVWQSKNKFGCDRHQLRLLSKCTNCGTPFSIPAQWIQGECPHCFLPFTTMLKCQKHL